MYMYTEDKIMTMFFKSFTHFNINAGNVAPPKKLQLMSISIPTIHV